MKRCIKTFCVVLALLLSLSALAGCHGARKQDAFEIPDDFEMPDDKPNTEEESDIRVEQQQYEITFWAKNDTNQTQVDIYKKAVADFEALYPSIKVNLRLYTDYGKIYQDVITNIATGTTPNVCITYPDHIATYMTGANTVVPLDDLMTHSKYGLGGSALRFDGPTKDEIIPQYLEEGQIDGVQYALPFLRSTEACYVNKTYVEKLGFTLPETLTWDFIWEVCAAANVKDGNGNYLVNGKKTMIPCIYKSTDNMMIQMLAQMNAPYSTKWGEIKLFNDTTKALLLDIAPHAASKEFSTFKISSYPANFLNAGECIFAIDSTAGASWMGSEAPNIDISEDKLVHFETAVMPIPQMDPANPKMISQGPSLCVFNKEDSGEVMASWLFAQYLLTNEVQIAYAQTEGYVPVTKKAQSSAEYRDYLSRAGEDNDLYYDIKLAATRLTIENTGNTFVTPVFNGSAALRNAAGQLIEEVVKGARRKKVIDSTFIENLYEEMIALHRLNEIIVRVPTNSGENGEASQGGVQNQPNTQVEQLKPELGEMPSTSIALLVVLGVTWLGIGAYVGYGMLKKRKNHR